MGGGTTDVRLVRFCAVWVCTAVWVFFWHSGCSFERLEGQEPFKLKANGNDAADWLCPVKSV